MLPISERNFPSLSRRRASLCALRSSARLRAVMSAMTPTRKRAPPGTSRTDLRVTIQWWLPAASVSDSSFSFGAPEAKTRASFSWKMRASSGRREVEVGAADERLARAAEHGAEGVVHQHQTVLPVLDEHGIGDRIDDLRQKGVDRGARRGRLLTAVSHARCVVRHGGSTRPQGNPPHASGRCLMED